MTSVTLVVAAGLGLGLAACKSEPREAGASGPARTDSPIENKLAQYTMVHLTTDLHKLTDNERFQGKGDYAGVTRFMAEQGKVSTQLQQDLARLGSKGIPVDIIFEQGPGALR